MVNRMHAILDRVLTTCYGAKSSTVNQCLLNGVASLSLSMGPRAGRNLFPLILASKEHYPRRAGEDLNFPKPRVHNGAAAQGNE